MTLNTLLRLFLTFSSVSLFIIVYLIQRKINPLVQYLEEYAWLTYFLYVFIPFIITYFSLQLCRYLGDSSINKISSIETSNNDFLSNYLAFFFVALSIHDKTTFLFIFCLTLLFTFVSRVSYFNPIFLVFGYNFYYVTTAENVNVLLICKDKLRNPQSFESMKVKRINDYTYIKIL